MSKSETCPQCGGRALPILFGMPTPDASLAAERGELILGGCMVPMPEPKFGCADCGFTWGTFDPLDQPFPEAH